MHAFIATISLISRGHAFLCFCDQRRFRDSIHYLSITTNMVIATVMSFRNFSIANDTSDNGRFTYELTFSLPLHHRDVSLCPGPHELRHVFLLFSVILLIYIAYKHLEIRT